MRIKSTKQVAEATKKLTLTVGTAAVTDVEVSYQRNGVCGTGFHTVYFTYTEDGEKTGTKLIAVVHDKETQELAGGVMVAVLDPANPESHWRGDQFEAAMRKAIKRYQIERFGSADPE